MYNDRQRPKIYIFFLTRKSESTQQPVECAHIYSRKQSLPSDNDSNEESEQVDNLNDGLTE